MLSLFCRCRHRSHVCRCWRCVCAGCYCPSLLCCCGRLLVGVATVFLVDFMFAIVDVGGSKSYSGKPSARFSPLGFSSVNKVCVCLQVGSAFTHRWDKNTRIPIVKSFRYNSFRLVFIVHWWHAPKSPLWDTYWINPFSLHIPKPLPKQILIEATIVDCARASCALSSKPTSDCSLAHWHDYVPKTWKKWTNAWLNDCKHKHDGILDRRMVWVHGISQVWMKYILCASITA